MLDLEYVSEIFEEAQGMGREYFGLGFQIEHRSARTWPCKSCGLPWWLHDRLGCRPALVIPFAAPVGLSRGYWRQRHRYLHKQRIKNRRRYLARKNGR